MITTMHSNLLLFPQQNIDCCYDNILLLPWQNYDNNVLLPWQTLTVVMTTYYYYHDNILTVAKTTYNYDNTLTVAMPIITIPWQHINCCKYITFIMTTHKLLLRQLITMTAFWLLLGKFIDCYRDNLLLTTHWILLWQVITIAMTTQ